MKKYNQNKMPLPFEKEMVRCYRLERLVATLPRIALICFLLALVTIPLFLLLKPLVLPLWFVVLLTLLPLFVGGVLLLRAWFGRFPHEVLARRADKVLGLFDQTTTVRELDDSHDWYGVIAGDLSGKLNPQMIRERWKVALPKKTYAFCSGALCCMALAAWFGTSEVSQSLRLTKELAQAGEERLQATEEILEDWEEFAELTDDEELRELFSETAKLREAMASSDPMEAMLAVSEFEKNISAMEESLGAESLAEHADAMADAFEPFEGMSGVSAALRAGDFSKASHEAEKRLKELQASPRGKSSLRQPELTAEKLKELAKKLSGREQGGLKNAVGKLGKSATKAAQSGQKSGQLSNQEMASAMQDVKDSLSKESAAQSQGRMLAMARRQLDAMRERMRAQGDKQCSFPSLRQEMGGDGQQAGGSDAGSGTNEQVFAEETAAMEAGVQEMASGQLGEGDSETTTMRDSAGSKTAASASTRNSALQNFKELSQRAVEGEDIPMAYRQTVRTYFESIRPEPETSSDL
ncbi:MAG: hypothetical protein ACK5LK_08870 [Chthoniobacterales bacterium]